VTGSATVRVVMLGGESHTIPFNSSLKVKDFKTFVRQKFRVEAEMQKLLYQEKILEVCIHVIAKSLSGSQ
jgi:hypothetical protein